MNKIDTILLIFGTLLFFSFIIAGSIADHRAYQEIKEIRECNDLEEIKIYEPAFKKSWDGVDPETGRYFWIKKVCKNY